MYSSLAASESHLFHVGDTGPTQLIMRKVGREIKVASVDRVQARRAGSHACAGPTERRPYCRHPPFAPSMACVFRTAMDRDNATSRCPWVSPDDESVIRSEEERHACVSEMIDGRLRRALVVAVEENNDRLSTIDITERGVVEIRYCDISPLVPVSWIRIQAVWSVHVNVGDTLAVHGESGMDRANAHAISKVTRKKDNCLVVMDPCWRHSTRQAIRTAMIALTWRTAITSSVPHDNLVP